MSKGSDYVRQIPQKKILSVLIHFDIAVALFLICDIIRTRNNSLFENLSVYHLGTSF